MDVRERLSLTERWTETALSTVLVALLDVHGPGGRPMPSKSSGDETEMKMWVLARPLTLPLLLVHVQERGRDDLGVELGGRDRLRRHPDLRRALPLGHPQRVVDNGRGVDLHGHGVGVGRVETVEVEHLLEVIKHPLDAPP